MADLEQSLDVRKNCYLQLTLFSSIAQYLQILVWDFANLNQCDFPNKVYVKEKYSDFFMGNPNLWSYSLALLRFSQGLVDALYLCKSGCVFAQRLHEF